MYVQNVTLWRLSQEAMDTTNLKTSGHFRPWLPLCPYIINLELDKIQALDMIRVIEVRMRPGAFGAARSKEHVVTVE